MGDDDRVFGHHNMFVRFLYGLGDLIEKPVIWVRESIVLPNNQKTYWYHEKIRRVPTIDECYIDDKVCIYEAQKQYERDRKVDKNIIHILKKRLQNCTFDNRDEPELCDEMKTAYLNAIDNYFIKYGDLGFRQNAFTCYMKQKHRMAWERRHGPVGTGKRAEKEDLPPKNKGEC